MSYPSLSIVRENLKVRWYRCPIESQQLHVLLKRNDLSGWKQAGGHLALWLLSAAMVYWCWSSGWWIALVAALMFHGMVSSFFVGVAPHELGHGTVFKTKWLNTVFLHLFSFISWWDPYDYASSHTYHHRYTLHPEGDRENLLPLSPNTDRLFLLQMATFNLFTTKGRTFGKGGVIATLVATVLAAMGKTGPLDVPSNEWLDTLHNDLPTQHRKSVWWSRFLLGAHGLVLVLSITSGLWILIFIISLPSFFFNLPSYAVGMTQHCGLKQNDNDFRKSVRSIKINPVLEFLYWHMNWHTEHHMFAGVPCYNLKALHDTVKDDMPKPRTLRQAWVEMIETWKLQQTEPDYYHDTPVPSAVRVATRDATSMEASIGELAPQDLR